MIRRVCAELWKMNLDGARKRLATGGVDALNLPPVPKCEGSRAVRAFLLKVYSIDGDAPRTCYGATLFG